MSQKALTPVNVPWAAADPAGPNLRAGDLYANSGTKQVRLYDGAAWHEYVDLSSAQTISGVKTFSGGYRDTTTYGDIDNGPGNAVLSVPTAVSGHVVESGIKFGISNYWTAGAGAAAATAFIKGTWSGNNGFPQLIYGGVDSHLFSGGLDVYFSRLNHEARPGLTLRQQPGGGDNFLELWDNSASSVLVGYWQGGGGWSNLWSVGGFASGYRADLTSGALSIFLPNQAGNTVPAMFGGQSGYTGHVLDFYHDGYNDTAPVGYINNDGSAALPYYATLGITGATAASRWVGGTASGAPTTGTFAAGDYVIAQDGHVWICSVAGSPGTWVDASAGGGGGGVPAITVVTETGWAQASAVGTSTNYARQDHTHGTPATPATSVAGRTGAVTLTAADIGGGTFPGAYTISGATTINNSLTVNGVLQATMPSGTAVHRLIQANNAGSAYSNTTQIFLDGAADTTNSPRLAFHLSNVVASQIGMDRSGTIRTYDNPGTGYANFAAGAIYGSRFVAGDVLIYDAGYCRIVNGADNTWKQLNAGAIFDSGTRVFSANYAPSYPGNVAWGVLTGIPGTFASADNGVYYGASTNQSANDIHLAQPGGPTTNAWTCQWRAPGTLGGGTSTSWINVVAGTAVSSIAGTTKINAGTKTFVIDHPTPEKKDKYLVHAAVEGPESAVFYRGRARLDKGIASVKLPDYFNDLCDEETATVQLTPLSVWIHDHHGVFNDEHDCVVNWTTPIPEYEKTGCSQHVEVPNLVTSPIVDGEFVVGRAGGFTGEWTETAEFYWLVIAERKDVPRLEVERDKATTRVEGDGPYRYIVE